MYSETGSQWNVAELESAAHRHLISPAEELAKLGTAGGRPLFTSADGIYITDSRGRRMIDGPAGMWCTQVGYNCKPIADAIAAQALRICYNSPWYSLNGPSAELARRISEFAPGDLNHVFFTTGGSSAVDSALRFVQFFNNVLGRHSKKKIICRIDGYHGSSHLTAACSGRAGNRPNFDLELDNVTFISAPNRYRHPQGGDEAAFLEFLVAEFEERIESLGPQNVGAFLAEPVLASGGVIVPPKGYHRRFRDICRKHDILYISDEVVTGFGRCGEWFASEKVFDIVPDIITFAKGVTSGYVPLGGFVISDAVLGRISGENAKGSAYTNGYTYSGHPVSCAAALANIEVIEQEGLLEHVREIAPYFQEQLRKLGEIPLVGDARGIGLLGCVECATDPHAPAATDFDKAVALRIDRLCYENGLIVRPIGSMCVLSPALIIKKEEIDTMISILRDSIEKVQGEIRAEGRF
ncbi:aminotransferase [Mesorhizobium sp. BH1-1-5]|uniref:aminotransferase n=1 Tax=unclassified Mesorhizobium TaxID=325217 RepID=UPI0011279806|nr:MULTISPECIES: aminotransferase [unclassified Mesorhizobium]MBZ9988915.1 aminotransferase [Mesorhizobium sp. BH1-1-5]TPJ71230.1 aminotransferase [Mesorhizobium sp. B2-7-1]